MKDLREKERQQKKRPEERLRFLQSHPARPELHIRIWRLKELKKLVGEKISVMIISILPKEGKLIFSEKDNNPEERQEVVSKYSVGDELDCEVTGIVDFGVFLKIEDGLEGLVHISELDWGLVEDPRSMFKLKDKVQAKIIDIKDGKISLSIKALKSNPWTEAAKKYKKDDIVQAVLSNSTDTVHLLQSKKELPVWFMCQNSVLMRNSENH